MFSGFSHTRVASEHVAAHTWLRERFRPFAAAAATTRVGHTWCRGMRWQDEKENSQLSACFFQRTQTAREDIGSSFYVIKTEDLLGNVGLVGRDREREQSTLRLELCFIFQTNRIIFQLAER